MLAHAYTIIIYRGVGTPGYRKYVVGDLNTTYKRFLSMLMKTLQLPGTVGYDKQVEIHTSNLNKDISLAREIPKQLLDPVTS